MARPTITYNASSGSNAAASGAGPATAITGSAAAYSGDGAGGGTLNIITFTNTPDLSGLAADGSEALWLNTPTGERHLFRITAANDTNKTVTVHASPETAISSGSAVDYAIGGKRQTLESDSTQPDWDDVESGWTFELEAGTYTITSSIQLPTNVGDHTNGPFTIRSSNPGIVQPIIDRTTDFYTIDGTSGCQIIAEGLRFTRSSGSGVSGGARGSSLDYLALKNIEIDASGMGIGVYPNSSRFTHIYNLNCYGCTTSGGGQGIGLYATGGTGSKIIAQNFSLHDHEHRGIYVNIPSYGAFCFSAGHIYDNADSGIYVNSAGTTNGLLSMQRLNLFGNSGDGLEVFDSTGDDDCVFLFEECTMSNNGGYGANIAADQIRQFITNRNNHYYGNTLGARNNLPAGTGDITGDPLFTSVTDGSENFTPATGSPLLDAGISAPTA